MIKGHAGHAYIPDFDIKAHMEILFSISLENLRFFIIFFPCVPIEEIFLEEESQLFRDM